MKYLLYIESFAYNQDDEDIILDLFYTYIISNYKMEEVPKEESHNILSSNTLYTSKFYYKYNSYRNSYEIAIKKMEKINNSEFNKNMKLLKNRLIKFGFNVKGRPVNFTSHYLSDKEKKMYYLEISRNKIKD